MISQDLINHVESVIDDSQGSAVDISTGKLTELLSNYIALIEQNAELHKELAKLKGDRVFITNNTKKWIELK